MQYKVSDPRSFELTHTETLAQPKCIERFGQNATMIHPNTLCTINRINVGTCARDAGSPLTTRMIPKVLVGIASWNRSPCARGFPDVYVRIFSHLQFIRAVMAE